MTLRDVVADLLAQAASGPPTAAALLERYQGSATSMSTAGPQLSHPEWASRVNGAGDVYLDLDGVDLHGLQLWEDSRGWGAYVELAVARGVLADVEVVTGPTKPMPRAPGATRAGDKVSAYVPAGGKTVRVFVELVQRGPAVARVTIHFQR